MLGSEQPPGGASSRPCHRLQLRERVGLGVDWGLQPLGKYLRYRVDEGGEDSRREAASRGKAESRGRGRKGINEIKGETGSQNIENVPYFVWLPFVLPFT